jgi:alkylation response protein AidB-like acyl-CoA dehydrogenase
VEFELDSDQREIERALRAFLADAMPLQRLRAVAAGRSGFDRDFWSGLCELGIPGLMVPEALGGTGLKMLDAAVVAECLGHAAAPTPFVASVVMAPLAILAAGSDVQKSRWLPAIASGDMRVAVCCGSFAGTSSAAAVRLAGQQLTGEAGGVLDGAGATHLLVFDAAGRPALVEAGAPGVRLTLEPTLDRTRPLGTVLFDRAHAEPLEAHDPRIALRVLDAGRVMLAADALGACQCMLEKAVDYAGQRVQFGRVIASFQAVKHLCAEMATAIEPSRSLVWYAAHAQESSAGEEGRTSACLAKAHLAEVGRDVARTATEVHGGMGFTDLMGLHYWFKRLSFDRQVLGGPERCRQEAATAQGW